MKAVFKVLGLILTTALFTVAGFIGGFYYNDYLDLKEAEVFNPEVITDNIDVQLPGEVEKFIITVDEVEAHLQDIGELSTHSGNYTITKGKEFLRYWLDDYPIWGTSNSVTLTCSGIVKVGYDINNINVVVDSDSYKIYITLPKAKLNDNYIIWDTVVCTEENNILNPIDFAQYQSMIEEIEADGLAEVESMGIYEEAEEHMKWLVEEFLSDIPEYQVVFI